MDTETNMKDNIITAPENQLFAEHENKTILLYKADSLEQWLLVFFLSPLPRAVHMTR